MAPDKKALSYVKQRRNVYGENNKSSRRNIRRRKRARHRSDRHREHQILGDVTAGFVPDSLEDKLQPAVRRWRKWPDAPLADVLEHQLRRRAELGMLSPEQAEKLISRIRRRAHWMTGRA